MTDSIMFNVVLVFENLLFIIADELRRCLWRLSPKKSMSNAPLCHLFWCVENGTKQMRFSAWKEINKRADKMSFINIERIKDRWGFTHLYPIVEDDKEIIAARDECLDTLHKASLLAYDAIREREKFWKMKHGSPREREELAENE